MKLNWGQSIFLFFVVFITLAIAFIIFSLRQNNDLVTIDYYEKGADFTRQMEVNNRSAIYIDSIRLLNQNPGLVACFSQSIRQMTDTIQINFYRPSNKEFDFDLKAFIRSDSLHIDKARLQKGRYKVKFQWNYRNEIYQVEKEFFVE